MHLFEPKKKKVEQSTKDIDKDSLKKEKKKKNHYELLIIVGVF